MMNRSLALWTSSLSTRNCRNSLTPSRVRRGALAQNLDKQWRELRRHATIDKDPETLLRLTAELDKRRRQAEAVGQRNGN
jgi:hypothetical protein